MARADMNVPALIATAQALLTKGKGLLAMDESIGTCNQRFAALGIAQTPEMRCAYRELLLNTPGLSAYISGAILVDQTLHQTDKSGRALGRLALDAGLLVGIKVDTGAKPLAGHAPEQVTEGLDGLRARLADYYALGARFAKWRGVFRIEGDQLPSSACITANAHALARYASLCQEAGLVPIVEPEVLMAGSHTITRGQDVTQAVLRATFDQLSQQGVVLEALILKPNMVIAGVDCPIQNSPAEVAGTTLACLLRTVPAAVPGIAFLSGGQSGDAAAARLSAMHRGAAAPWALTFSFARALQYPALPIWAGLAAHAPSAQAALLHRARCASAALSGAYTPALEAG